MHGTQHTEREIIRPCPCVRVCVAGDVNCNYTHGCVNAHRFLSSRFRFCEGVININSYPSRKAEATQIADDDRDTTHVVVPDTKLFVALTPLGRTRGDAAVIMLSLLVAREENVPYIEIYNKKTAGVPNGTKRIKRKKVLQGADNI